MKVQPVLKPTIAVFDFDGTLFHGDSLYYFIVNAIGKSGFYKAIMKNLLNIIRWKTGFISNSVAKERLFRSIFHGMDKQRFITLCNDFEKIVDSRINKEVVDLLKHHIEEGHQVYIVSASPSEWISPWAKKTGVKEVIGTRLEYLEEKLTGNFVSPNCYGPEKVKRFLEVEPHRDDYELISYGDSRGDREMFELSNQSVRV